MPLFKARRGGSGDDYSAAASANASGHVSGTTTPATGSGSAANAGPYAAILRVQILRAKELAAKDRSGASDPFVIVSLPGAGKAYRRQTPVVPKSLDPEWKDADATFDFEIPNEWLNSDGLGTGNEDEAPSVASGLQSAAGVATAPFSAVAAPGEVDEDAAVVGSQPAGHGLQVRPENRRRISGAATKILSAPVRIGARGAVAGARAVRRRTPRPIRHRNAASAHGDAPGGQSIFCPAALEFVVWDKDRWTANDYIGEVSLPTHDWCRDACSFDTQEPIWLPLVSSRRRLTGQPGSIQVRVGLVTRSSTAAHLPQIFERLVLAAHTQDSHPTRAVPADQSVGTTGPDEAFLDNGLSSGDDSDELEELVTDDDEDDNDDEDASDTDAAGTATEAESDSSIFDEHFKSVVGGAGATAPLGTAAVPQASAAEAASVSPVDVAGVSAGAPTAGKVPSISAPEQKGGKLRRKLGRGFSSRSVIKTSSSTTSSTEAALVTDGDGIIDGSKRRRRRKQRKATDPTQKTKEGKRKKQAKKGSLDDEYAFKASSDIIGIVQMEIKSACDLPRWKNSLHTGFDMDPMCIVSFSDKIFRTRVQRHTLSPVWDEKLLFHVRRHEAQWKTKLSIFDWDKLSAHDHVGSTEISVADLIEEAPKPDVQTKLYNADVNALERPMRRFELPLSKSAKDKADTKSQSLLVVEAKFTPYDALRQRFWRQMLLNYDSNDSKTISTLELTSMLDSLGSTLGSLTIQEFWQQHNKRPDEDDLTFDEAILSLEAEVNKTWDEKRTARSDGDVSGPASGTVTPAVEVTANALDYSGPNAPIASETQLAKNAGLSSLAAVEPSASENEPSSKRLTPPGASVPGVIARDMSQLSLSSSATSSSANSTSSSPLASAHRGASSGSSFSQHAGGAPRVNSQVKERVIYCKSCPLCHMPRLGRKAEVDIITHLAVCASQDWRRVDSLMVSNFVTASQAQRKWYTKVLTRISQGDYKLGADSANIIVQDRVTGELLEEKMAVYVRLGIRLLYRGGKSRMEGARVRRMLHNMSVKQGAKFDDPASAREIPSFIAFHNLKMDEVLEPLENFKTFNQFFYRKLKPDARPVDELENHKRLVSGADCRMQAFQSVEDSKKFWIKGKQFTIPNLLGDQYKDASAYDNGPLAIFRLAPQDYHRYHSPVDATVGEITPIPGEYYTVNPQAIRSTVEVYCANVRTIVELHTEEFGRVLYVCIGAMLVGSSIQTVKTGDKIKRGDEIGYFAFGGSTILLVFPKGAVEFDKDLLDNSKQSLETLVRVGMGIGRAPQ